MSCEIVRAFTVLPSQIETFESTYGPEGPWARLYRNVRDYRGTRLIADMAKRGDYIAIDEWSSHEAWLAFQNDHPDAFAALDAACSPLLQTMTFIGAFRVVSP
ncbi:hypothetical protein [Swaminathania salitolerans]|uniref:ABM domain-containing protein n=1 Tax=Swaminathania salitolerans TaxID=182838 RepID=A0A511BQY6_9PROT|nr:hypothetical protein [Swaminathania salitolerans]GBQ12120.1 hypothetical protein AA21291_1080 [Swaminathania salitolerans LMG 21291]GEL02739.1 hypothetical protein SSA02_19020 [Swaminathania salitolerans]